MAAELLSPAGSWEAMVAAVQNGADAVYMGMSAFNARSSARNFEEDEFLAAVRYCHLRGVKVYLTLNILLTDREMSALADTARFASDAGVDAILVQDMGVFDVLRRIVPDVPLHASTQMSLHTLSGAREAARLGMTRVVLARELSGNEIAHICRDCGAEVETFAHGALCMCYSGQCAMSALIGSRGGNRGRCAQPCRLNYGFFDKADSYPLSLKDANLSAHLTRMSDMGIACLKLEGRMKRPEYVAAVTGIYSSLLHQRRGPTEKEQKQLAAAFSRSGFTDWYFLGKKGAEMFGTRGEDERWPEDWFSELRAAYEREDMRTVALRFMATIAKDMPASLSVRDRDGYCASVSGATPESARNRAITADEVTVRLAKTGGTAFHCEGVNISVEDGLSLSASAINALRRNALDELSALRMAPPQRRSLSYAPAAACKNPTKAPLFTVSVAHTAQITRELLALAPAWIYVPLEEMDKLPTSFLSMGNFCPVLPRIYRSADEGMFLSMLRDCAARGVHTAAVGNLGHLPLVREAGFAMRGDFSLNVFNSHALEFWREQGLSSATVSFELRHQQIRDLQKAIPCEAIVYGRLPLMITENCIISNNVGCSCAQGRELIDRTGARFPVMRVFGCRNEIENSRVLFLADKPEYRHIGLSFVRLRFTTEAPQECAAILRTYLGKEDFMPQDYTRGLFYRGVE